MSGRQVSELEISPTGITLDIRDCFIKMETWGYYLGYYYYMKDGTIIGEQVFIEKESKESIVNGKLVGYVTTQTTSDDALFDEFQNGDAHALTAYTLAEIDAMGWDAFVQGTGGQTWS